MLPAKIKAFDAVGERLRASCVITSDCFLVCHFTNPIGLPSWSVSRFLCSPQAYPRQRPNPHIPRSKAYCILAFQPLWITTPKDENLAGKVGFEPTTARVRAVCSRQLSYFPTLAPSLRFELRPHWLTASCCCQVKLGWNILCFLITSIICKPSECFTHSPSIR